MKRSDSPQNTVIPDAINCSKEKGFSIISNKVLRNPYISAKAKALLCLLLSNKDGWKSHMEMIKTMMKENESSIRSGLKELEEYQYLIRVKYKNAITKEFAGSFWAYTDEPGNFNISKQIALLSKYGFIVAPSAEEMSTCRESTRGFSTHGESTDGITTRNNNIITHTNDKKTKINNTNVTDQKIPPPLELVKEYCHERGNKVDPERWFDFYQAKGWLIGKNKMKDWRAAVRTWEKNEQSSLSLSKSRKNYIDDYGDRYYYDESKGNYYNKDGKLYM